MSDRNTAIIDEFRASDGQLGGHFEGWDMLLLHHTGAKTGTERVTPLTYQPVGDDFAIFASKAGSDTNPDWYHNLLAHPDVEVEVGGGSVAVRARLATADEHRDIWNRQKREKPQFAEYEQRTARDQIPVFILTTP